MKKKDEKINIEKVNQAVSLTNKVLSIVYTMMILSIIALGVFLLKETKVLTWIWGAIKIISPLFIGLIVAWLFDPFVNWLQKKGVNRVLGAIFSFFILLLVIVIFFIFLVPLLYEQINEFVATLPGMLSTVKTWLEEFFDKFAASGINLTSTKEQIFKNLETFGVDLTSSLPGTLVSFVTSVVSGIGVFGIGLIVGFYLLIDFDGVRHSLDFLPKKIYIPTITLCRRLNGALRDFIQGTLVISLLMSIVSTIGFWIIGLKSPILFGLIVGITNIIPYLGPWIGGALAAVVGFTTSPLVGVLAILVAFIAQQIDSIVFQPLILSKTMKLHPVTIVVGLLIFGYIGGILGMILATPIMAGIKIIFEFFNEKYEFTKKLKLQFKFRDSKAKNTEKNVEEKE